MTRDEILDEYEALWRQAMVEGRTQFCAPEGGPRILRRGSGSQACAILVADKALLDRACDVAPLHWACPTCGYSERTLISVLIHLNNEHGWTWDMFANKFRDALGQGESS